MIKLFHGSNVKIEVPDLVHSKPFSLPRLVEELKFAKGITFQYFFGTERALKLLKRL